MDKEPAENAMREAEERFQSNDIEGAKRMVLRAQKLFPSLPGLPQILAAFNVHIAAASKDAKDHTNWYALLEVDPSDDINTIKKQYKKLSLLTHPDRNRSSAAEGAFKLVIQAWEAMSAKAGSSEKGSTGASCSSPNSGADDQHSSTSDARSSSRPSSAQSDPKNSSSKAEVACPKCRRSCKSLDCDLIIRCSYCNLFALRTRRGSSVDLTIDEHGLGISWL